MKTRQQPTHGKRRTCWIVLLIAALPLLAQMSGCRGSLSICDGVIPASLIQGNLEGPFEMTKVAPGPVLLVSRGKDQRRVALRGVKPTGDATVDDCYRAELEQWLSSGEVYLIKDTVIKEVDGTYRAVVLTPTTQYGEVDISTGEMRSHTANYAVVQLWDLKQGQLVVDRSDTTHWLYKSFLKAESVGRAKKLGYWESHKE